MAGDKVFLAGKAALFSECEIYIWFGMTDSSLMKYKAIFERNADRLVNANTIYEGQVIVLPAK